MPDVKLGPNAVHRSQTQPGPEFPVPLTAFLATLKGSKDEIWSRLLKMDHGLESHTMTEWKATLNKLRNRRT